MTDIIGTGHIELTRLYLSGELMALSVPDAMDLSREAEIPSMGKLVIWAHFGFEPFPSPFAMESIELMTNFVTTNFSGKMTMGFTEVVDIAEDFRTIEFQAAPFPTSFSPEAVIKLHYIEKATSTRFTSYFKCSLSSIYRPRYDVLYRGHVNQCDFSIINPHAHTYHSSEQAKPVGMQKMRAIPANRRIDDIPSSSASPKKWKPKKSKPEKMKPKKRVLPFQRKANPVPPPAVQTPVYYTSPPVQTQQVYTPGVDRKRGGFWTWVTFLLSLGLGLLGVAFIDQGDGSTAVAWGFAAVGLWGSIRNWRKGKIWGLRIFWILVLAIPCLLFFVPLLADSFL